MRFARVLVAASLLLLAPAVAARPKRPESLPVAPPPAQVVEPATPPVEPAPQAGPLFPSGVPVDVGNTPKGLANLTAQGCGACHGAVAEAWSTSAHAGGLATGSFRAALTAAGDDPACASCHLPLTLQHRLLAPRGGPSSEPSVPNPAWEPSLQVEGVTCAACHVRDGAVVGTGGGEGAPHRALASAELTTSEVCATCHQLSWPGGDAPIYDTFGEWSRSAYARAGVRCQDCHMPPVASPVTVGGFAGVASHAFAGQGSSALTLLIRLPPEGVVRGEPAVATLRVQNTGAGHAFPTGSPFKKVRIDATLLGPNGKPVGAPWSTLLAREVTPEPPYTTVSDTRLPAGGEVLLEIPLDVDQEEPGGRGSFRLRVVEVGADGLDRAVLQEQVIPLPIE